MGREHVEVIDHEIRIPAQGHEPLRAAIASLYEREFEDVEKALIFFDLVVTQYDESDAIVGLERDAIDDSWAGDQLYQLLAPDVEANNFLVFRYLGYDGEMVQWKVLFDGAGDYRSLDAKTVYEE